MFKLLTTLLLLSAVPSAYFQTSSFSPTLEPSTPEPSTAKPTTPEPTDYTTTHEEGTTTMGPETTTTPGPVVECEQLTLDGCGGKSIKS